MLWGPWRSCHPASGKPAGHRLGPRACSERESEPGLEPRPAAPWPGVFQPVRGPPSGSEGRGLWLERHADLRVFLMKTLFPSNVIFTGPRWM